MNWKEEIVHFFYPKRCLFCDEVIGSHERNRNLCQKCSDQVQYLTDHLCRQCGKPLETHLSQLCHDCSRHTHLFVANRAVWSYHESVRAAIHRFKYQGRRGLAEAFAEETCRFYKSQIPWQVDMVTSVPLHPKKLKARGYNQAALLASRLGRKLGLRVDNHLLKRTKSTKPQKDLTDAERILNVKDAFIANGESYFKGLNILLLDDVYTTGNTLDACTKELLSQGAHQVYCLTIAIGKGF